MPFAGGFLAGGLHTDAGCGAFVAIAVALAATARAPAFPLRIGAAALAAGLACGALAATLAHLPLPADHVARLAGRGIAAAEGVVVRSDVRGDRVSLVVRVVRVRARARAGSGRGLLGVTVAHAQRAWPVGAAIRVVGKLRRPQGLGNPDEYDHAAALRRRGILVTLFLWSDETIMRLDDAAAGMSGGARARLAVRVAAAADEPVRGYLAAVLLGAARSLDDATRDALTRTGLAHVVSVSGFHVAVAAGGIVVALRRALVHATFLALRCDVTKIAALLGVVPVGAYAALAGDSIPAARSFLTYGVVLAALAGDRPPDPLRALAGAAVVLALGAPDVAADVSFQLSFASVLALILVARAARRDGAAAAGAPGWCRRLVLAPLRVSLAATLATAPLTAWHFQQISLVAPFANLAALPLLGPATLLPGLIALPVALVAPSWADALLWVAARAAGAGLGVAGWFAAWPGAAVATPMPSLPELGLAYAALGLVWTRGAPRTAAGVRARRRALLLLALAAGVDTAWWTWERCCDPRLRVTFLAVGQGDAAVVELPRGGGVLVVDGGGLAGDFDPGARVVAPFLRGRKIARIEALVLSHPQFDHYGGLAHLAGAFRARELWWNGMRGQGVRFAALERALAAAGTRSVVLRRGMAWSSGGGVVVEVLHPEDPRGLGSNDASLVLRLRFGATAVLFTGDVEAAAEHAMLAARVELRSDVLKVPHHGSATSSSADFVAAVAPRIAVVSSGAANRFGFPARAVVDRLAAAGAGQWNTAEHGALRVVSDGRDVSVVPTRASRAPRFVFPHLLW
ncbi:MAG: DNA internalization-related competence protein ComEC/Rec2 [Deltaproteobacteria bacterium]|nr:DNA internalization-related competence protein ComEC/Rec2 [Deltaproteobacteria bacterium]